MASRFVFFLRQLFAKVFIVKVKKSDEQRWHNSFWRSLIEFSIRGRKVLPYAGVVVGFILLFKICLYDLNSSNKTLSSVFEHRLLFRVNPPTRLFKGYVSIPNADNQTLHHVFTDLSQTPLPGPIPVHIHFPSNNTAQHSRGSIIYSPFMVISPPTPEELHLAFNLYSPNATHSSSTQSQTDSSRFTDDASSLEMAQKVRAAAQHVFKNYYSTAWGADELKPVTGGPASNRIVQGSAVTLIDFMSTLWIMGLHSEFNKSAEYIENHLFTNCPYSGGEKSVSPKYTRPHVGTRPVMHGTFFEVTIRVLGGLLSAYTLSGRESLLHVVHDIGNRYLQIFSKSPNGYIPPKTIDLCHATGSWTYFEQFASIAEIGTFQLEFRTLTFLTGNVKFLQIANMMATHILVTSALQLSPVSAEGKSTASLGLRLFPRSGINLKSVEFTVDSGYTTAHRRQNANSGMTGNLLTAGSDLDSFLEYLLKVYIQSDRTEHRWRRAWHCATDEMIIQLVHQVWKGKANLDMDPYDRSPPFMGNIPAAAGWDGDIFKILQIPKSPISTQGFPTDDFFWTFLSTASNYRKIVPINRLQSISHRNRSNEEEEGHQNTIFDSLNEYKRPSTWIFRNMSMVEEPKIDSSYVPSSFAGHLRTNELRALSHVSDIRLNEILRNVLNRAAERITGRHRPSNSMEHLACFVGGMFMLGVDEYKQIPSENNIVDSSNLQDMKLWEWLAREVTKTCVGMYLASPTGIAPDKTSFKTSSIGVIKEELQKESKTEKRFRLEKFLEYEKAFSTPRRSLKSSPSSTPLFSSISYPKSSSHSLLRPETIESLYYLEYFSNSTGQYRVAAAEIFNAFEIFAKTKFGYSSLVDVQLIKMGGHNETTTAEEATELKNNLESFFLAETLKYLYLIFMPKSVLNLRDWVFNTEGHPIPVLKGGLPTDLRDESTERVGNQGRKGEAEHHLKSNEHIRVSDLWHILKTY